MRLVPWYGKRPRARDRDLKYSRMERKNGDNVYFQKAMTNPNFVKTVLKIVEEMEKSEK
jgi:hypothetical protein